MLDISPILLFSTAAVFLLVVARLNSTLFKPLLKHMDDRAESIKKDLENAKSNNADLDGIISEANSVISAAKKEASAIRQKAYDEAKQIAYGKLEKAKIDLEVKSKEFHNNLEQETKNLKDKLIVSMPQFNKSLKAKLNSI